MSCKRKNDDFTQGVNTIMNLSRNLLVGAALASLLLGGCTSKVTEKAQYSGFLSNYNNLQEVETQSGGTAMPVPIRARWVSRASNLHKKSRFSMAAGGIPRSP